MREALPPGRGGTPRRRPSGTARRTSADEHADSTPLIRRASRAADPPTRKAHARAAVEAIAERPRRSCVIGAGANRKLTARDAARVRRRDRHPFFSTQMGKGVVDEHHPLLLGCAALSEGDFVHRAIERPT